MFECFYLNKKYKCIVTVTIIVVIVTVFLIYKFQHFFIILGDILNKYSQGIIALSAFLGLIFGQLWLDTSKKKMKGKLEYDIARRYLKSVFKIRDTVKIVRNPFIPIVEIQKAFEKNGLKYENYSDNKQTNRYVYSLRWNNVQDAWTNFDEVLLEAEISWGEDAIKIQKDFDLLIRKLRSVVFLFVNHPEVFNNKLKENQGILYEGWDENNAFTKSIDIQIEKIRTFLKKYI